MKVGYGRVLPEVAVPVPNLRFGSSARELD
jgi:hypothetical protein